MTIKVEQIEVGQIWIIMRTMDAHRDETAKCPTCGEIRSKAVRGELPLGTLIEIRHPFAWNYRTCESVYYHSTPETILRACALFGVIHPEVRKRNNKNLAEILAGAHYDHHDPTQQDQFQEEPS